MELELFVKELKPGIYLMDEGHIASGYIVVGSEKVAVIDTMNGFNDVKAAVRKITDKPIIVINTHGHGDHIFGNVYLEEAYLNPKDLELANFFMNMPEFKQACEEHGFSMPPFKPVKEGDVFDLGGRTLEVYELPGHTPGGIVLLLKEDRILFTGDAVNHYLWMMLDGCLKLSDYVKELDRLMFLENEADYILQGHAQDLEDISLMRCMHDGIVEIIEGKTENDGPFEWFGGVCKKHPFKLMEGKKYAYTDETIICYNPENI
ncbi:MAG: MBL fold metallo-hydrolase [Clostridiales bacterium]|nr:MBL fold metallo-hydrolase [Clostridiales bacterium]